MALLSLRNVSLAFGGPKLLDQVELQIEPGDGSACWVEMARGRAPCYG